MLWIVYNTTLLQAQDRPAFTFAILLCTTNCILLQSILLNAYAVVL